jgi:hypothetical protein
VSTRTIFRERAVEAYRRGAERDVLPRLVSGPTLACCWALVAVLVTAAAIAWSVRVPTYVAAPGVVVTTGAQPHARGETTAAVLLVPPERAAQFHAGQRVRAQIGSSGRFLEGAVAGGSQPLLGPDAVRDRNRLSGADGIQEPVRVVDVRLRAALPASAYAGTRFAGRIETGSQRLIALLPGAGGLLGGGP